MLAGAAGATVIGAALAPTKADAADGGTCSPRARQRAASSPTSISIDGTVGSASPTLVPEQRRRSVARPASRCTRRLRRSLEVGEIVNTVAGPRDRGRLRGRRTSPPSSPPASMWPTPTRFRPSECWTPASATSRAHDVVNGSPGPRFDSLAGSRPERTSTSRWSSTEGLDLAGVFLNVTAFRADGRRLPRGLHARAPARALPSIAFQTLVTASNSIFVAPATTAPVSAAGTYYTVRVFASRTTHGADRDASARSVGFSPHQGDLDRRAPDRRLQRQAKQRARLTTAIKNR